MKRTDPMSDPKHTQHRDLGGGWHLLHNARLGLVLMLCDPNGDKFDLSKNPDMSQEEARRVILSLTDATPAQKRLYLDMLECKHFTGEEVAR